MQPESRGSRWILGQLLFPAEAKGTVPSDFISNQGFTSKEEEAGCLAEERQRCWMVLEECLTLPAALPSRLPMGWCWSCSWRSQCKVLAGVRHWESPLAAGLQPAGKEGAAGEQEQISLNIQSVTNVHLLLGKSHKPSEPTLRLSLEKSTKKGQTILYGCNFTLGFAIINSGAATLSACCK